MRYWDASAVVPLVAAEDQSRACRRLLAEDREMLVWFLTPVEVISALARRARQNSLRRVEFRKSKEQLALLEQGWSEIIPSERVRERAYRLLESHPLRAADSLQLAAALVASDENPRSLSFVTLDQRLAAAAEKEGFSVLGG